MRAAAEAAKPAPAPATATATVVAATQGAAAVATQPAKAAPAPVSAPAATPAPAPGSGAAGMAAGAPLLAAALDDLIASRRREGEKLADMIRGRIAHMRELVARVQPRVPALVAEYQEKVQAVNAKAADVYRYMNFDQIPAFVEVADTVEM